MRVRLKQQRLLQFLAQSPLSQNHWALKLGQELGIRSALGATPGSLLRLILRYGLVAAGFGIALGVALALALSSRLEPLLFRTPARDPLVYGVTGALVLLIALLASAVPGRRATRADPLEAMRETG